MTLTETKKKFMDKVSTKEGLISALAFDQRGALKKMMAQYQTTEPTVAQMEELKQLVAEELTPYASAILLDPEFGLPAAQARAKNCGLLLAYEKTGYDTSSTSRLPDCLDTWSVKRLQEAGADAIKFLLYYDVDGDPQVNLQKQAYIERLGAECQAAELPFFLEILSYDEKLADNTSLEFAKVKPRKVIEAMKLFSAERFSVDVLKVEVPVNMNFVAGLAKSQVLTLKKKLENISKCKMWQLSYHTFISVQVFQQNFSRIRLFLQKKLEPSSTVFYVGVLLGRESYRSTSNKDKKLPVNGYKQLGVKISQV